MTNKGRAQAFTNKGRGQTLLRQNPALRQAQGKLATKLGDNAIIVKIPHFPEASKKFRFGRKTGTMPGENGDERTHGDHRKDHADE